MAKSPKTFTSHSPPRARTLSGPATRRRWTRELLQTRNRAFGPNGVPTTSRQTSATRTDTTSRLPISLGSTNKRYEPSTHLRPAAFFRPLGRIGTPADSAKVMVFLASDRSGWLRGEIILASGGLRDLPNLVHPGGNHVCR